MAHKDPIKRREYQRRYREQHAAEVLEYRRQYAEANPDLVKQRKREDYQQNKDAYKARAKASREARLEEIKAQRSTPEYKAKRSDLRKKLYDQKMQPIREEQAKQREILRLKAVRFDPEMGCSILDIDGYDVLLDTELAEDIDPLIWHVKLSNGGVPYFQVESTVDGDKQTAWLHRVAAVCPKDKEVDHISGDTLDNRRSNLRVCTRAQNAKNRCVSRTSRSGIKGVMLKPNGRWRASIQANGVKHNLGTFETAKQAAEAYDRAANKLHGEFARLNSL